jgi:predicted metal-dependent HD superfamily phosphohydrolase
MNLTDLFNKYNIKVDPKFILDCWSESHRSYHNLNHLNDLISQINEDYGDGLINETEREKLALVALFHDLVYDPTRDDNEEKSAEIFYRFCSEQHNIDLVEVKQMILDTKNHIPCTPLSQKFIDYDMNICERNFDELLEWEQGIREEYSMFSSIDYKNNRIKFLETCLDKFPMNTDNLLDLINWVKSNY